MKLTPGDSIEQPLELDERTIAGMRLEFFRRVTDSLLRRRILNVAFAFGEETGMRHGTDMLAWYLAQEEHRHELAEWELHYEGHVPSWIADATDAGVVEKKVSEHAGARSSAGARPAGPVSPPPINRAYVDAIRAAGKLESLHTREDAVDALAVVSAVWRACLDAGEIRPNVGRRYESDDDDAEPMRMRLYEDDLTTMLLLESGKYLPDGRKLTALDARLATALTELLIITTAVAPGYDINKRNFEAIDAHVRAIPEAGNLYPRWVLRRLNPARDAEDDGVESESGE